MFAWFLFVFILNFICVLDPEKGGLNVDMSEIGWGEGRKEAREQKYIKNKNLILQLFLLLKIAFFPPPT